MILVVQPSTLTDTCTAEMELSELLRVHPEVQALLDADPPAAEQLRSCSGTWRWLFCHSSDLAKHNLLKDMRDHPSYRTLHATPDPI